MAQLVSRMENAAWTPFELVFIVKKILTLDHRELSRDVRLMF